VAKRRQRAAREAARLARQGIAASPVVIEGRAIAKTFWGKAWCDNLESYHDFANRLPRGRTYVRNGSVLDLQMAPREVTATVIGSGLYRVSVHIDALPKARWRAICKDCAGGIDSLVELLQGRLSRGVMQRICGRDRGLFPAPREIRFECSCPDYAVMCKHVAAVLYGVGARLDDEPGLLFQLRAVDPGHLISGIDQALPKPKLGVGKVLEVDDLSTVFGLEMAQPAAAKRPSRRRKALSPSESDSIP
jgi:uncharacterized Zn finger protein